MTVTTDIITPDRYSPLNKTLLSVFNAYKAQDYAILFVFRDGWGDLLYAAVRPQTAPWPAFDEAAAGYGARQPLIAFDLLRDYHAQMPEHFLETLDTLDAFAYSPLICVPDRNGHVPADSRRHLLDELTRPALTAHINETPRRSPPSGKLRLV